MSGTHGSPDTPDEAQLPDGRVIAYEILGDRTGHPVVALHGTPGSRRQLGSADETAKDLGVHLIVPDRAGFGGSTHDPDRTMRSGAEDIVSLADHLGLDAFSVVGSSGGGPTALACAAVAPERVLAVATIGSVGPLVPRDPTLPPDRVTIRAARRSERLARWLFVVIVRSGRQRPEASLDRFARMLAPADAELLSTDTPIRAALLDDFRHSSPTAAAASARDFRLFTLPWDIDLAAIRAPVHVWHGAEDRNVPVGHANVIARSVPGANLHLVDGGGHLLLVSHHEPIFEALLNG